MFLGDRWRRIVYRRVADRNQRCKFPEGKFFADRKQGERVLACFDPSGLI
jgi:hypothetical protein